MTQASSWQQLINQIPQIKIGSPKKRIFTNLSEPGVLLGLLTIIVAMMLWNWQLLLSLAVGISVMLLTYSIQKWNWQLRLLEARKIFQNANTRLVLAVISGGVATVITYMMGSIWVDSASPWLATGTIVQGMATLLTLVLLMWQIFIKQINQEEDYIDNLLNKLTENQPLKRLLALRQLNKYLVSQDIDGKVKKDVGECLKLLLKQEKEIMIREAVLDCLETLDDFNVLSSDSRKVLIPINVTKKNKILVD